jgi:hypothetical protein
MTQNKSSFNYSTPSQCWRLPPNFIIFLEKEQLIKWSANAGPIFSASRKVA